MSTSSSTRRGRFWRTDWFAGVLVVVAVMVLYQATDFIGTPERRFHDYASTATSRKPTRTGLVLGTPSFMPPEQIAASGWTAAPTWTRWA